MTQRKSALFRERPFELFDCRTNLLIGCDDLMLAGGDTQPGTEIQTFEFRSGAGALLANVRAIIIDGMPWFIAADVAMALEYSQAQAMTKLVDTEDRDTVTILKGCNYVNQSVINESGLYAAIMGSNKPQAKYFKRWITSEVLPSIRKNGGYNFTPAESIPDFNDPAAVARAWADAYEKNQLITSYAQRQAKYITHLESLFTDGLTPVNFCRRLNGVNTSKINTWLMDRNWLYDDTPNAHRASWRVKSYARDQYLTETSKTITSGEHSSFEAFSPVLLKKGAVWLYRHYLKGELPMKATWNGEFTHDKELAELAGNTSLQTTSGE